MASYWEIQRIEGTGELLEDLATYVSQPALPERRPAVIVCQEVWGINAHIQNVADRLAEAGYFAVAPALFHREGTSEGVRGTNPILTYGPEDAEARTKYRENLTDDNIIVDINTTIEWLQKHPRVVGDKIGIVGFCVGGRITYLAATACPGLSAATVFYGGFLLQPCGEGPSPFDRTANIQCPVMGNFGDKDQNPTVDVVGQVEAALKEHGKTYDFKIYPGAGHGFFCDERDDYREEAARDAWSRTLGWFQKYLAPVAATA
jgi:carboxymethylenebutenolidase